MYPTELAGDRARSLWRDLWQFSTVRGSGNRVAAGYVLAATVGYSSMPLVIDWGRGGEAPFLFNAGWRYGFAVGCILFLSIAHGRRLLSKRIWGHILPRIWVWAMVFAVISHFDSTFFTISIRFVDVSVAAILFETWPILIWTLRILGPYERGRLRVGDKNRREFLNVWGKCRQ